MDDFVIADIAENCLLRRGQPGGGERSDHLGVERRFELFQRVGVVQNAIIRPVVDFLVGPRLFSRVRNPVPGAAPPGAGWGREGKDGGGSSL